MFRSFSQALSLSAIAAAVSTLLACGGGGSDDAAAGPTAEAVSGSDEADAATLAQVDQIVQSVDASARALGFDGTRDNTAATAPQHRVGRAPGLFPGVTQANLVANTAAYGAPIIEPGLLNPWGIAIRPAGLGGHFWLGANRSETSIEYVGDVGGTPLFQDALKVVTTGGPVTGVSFNPGTQFTITQAHPAGAITGPAKFFFANLSGTISAWTERQRADGSFDRPADSLTVIDASARHSAFFGVTVAPAADRLYAADFGAEAALRVYDGALQEQPALQNPYRSAGAATPGGFEAFNVQTLGSSVFAMYGRHVARDPNVPLPAEGRLAEFDGQGQLKATWRGRGMLNYPWGVALAPKDFGIYSGCLLVGNFGDGSVVAFHPRLKVALDYVRDDRGQRVVIDGLWGLQFGNGASLGEANHLYFAAGPNREADGLVGKLLANPRTLPFIGGVSLCR